LTFSKEQEKAVKGIQEIGATYLTSTYVKLYQFFALSMIAIVTLFGVSYFIGTAINWFAYFGVAFIVLLVSQIAVHIALKITFTEKTKDLISEVLLVNDGKEG
jgi:hypothetical protein